MQPKKAQPKAFPTLTRRELFAAHALAGMMMRGYPPQPDEAAAMVKKYADALEMAMSDESAPEREIP